MASIKPNAFALSHPLAAFLDKAPRDFERADFLKVIEKKGLERVTFHYTALDGRLKELKIPALDPAQVECILAAGERADGSSLFKGMVDAAVSDVYIVPDYKTAFLNPFDEKSLDFICRYLTRDGALAPFALDNILARAAALFRSRTGFELYALGELEFFLLSDPTDNLYPVDRQQGYHGAAPYIKSGPILNEMVNRIAQITGAVKYAHSEVGFLDVVESDRGEIRGKRAEQLEVEYLPKPIAEMADDVVLGRWIIRNVAHRHGSVATFTPKIEEGVAGNGLHFHLALMKDGLNATCGPDGKLSTEARRLVGGLLEYADSLTAFGNTVSSAYLRLVPHQEAPTSICWSDSNRSVLIRVPLGWTNLHHLSKILNPQDGAEFRSESGRQTVELRSPDGSAIVHLLLAGISMAADWAFRDEASLLFKECKALDLADRLYVKGNIFEDKELLKKLPQLPASCVASSRILLKKRGLYERDGIFPPSIVDYVARLLQAENDELMNKWLFDLPADDRLNETRKIMHKDLHRH